MLKGLAMLFGVGFILALIFIVYLVLKFSKEQKDELKDVEEDKEILEKQMRKYAEEKRDNEELEKKMDRSNNLDSFNASLELLQKQSSKGKNRNS